MAPPAEFCALIMHLLSSSAKEKQAGATASPVYRIDTVAIYTAGSCVAAAETQTSPHQLKCKPALCSYQLQKVSTISKDHWPSIFNVWIFHTWKSLTLDVKNQTLFTVILVPLNFK